MIYVPRYRPIDDYVADASDLMRELVEAEKEVWSVSPEQIAHASIPYDALIKPSTSGQGCTLTQQVDTNLLRDHRTASLTMPVPSTQQWYTIPDTGVLGTTPLSVTFQVTHDTHMIMMGSLGLDVVATVAWSARVRLALNGSPLSGYQTMRGSNNSPNTTNLPLFVRAERVLAPGVYNLTIQVSENRPGTTAASSPLHVNDAFLCGFGLVR